ncbi:hypothetical protein M6B38_354840 [Iris pallida]|uniref:Uncharacterized protein n=1 Tax=Iris pallida TaxID=29817 RepID=A0AAX6GP01_IRIPA|nr:hypothetical protein M6B38_354840 [Iris pallida]
MVDLRRIPTKSLAEHGSPTGEAWRRRGDLRMKAAYSRGSREKMLMCDRNYCNNK